MKTEKTSGRALAVNVLTLGALKDIINEIEADVSLRGVSPSDVMVFIDDPAKNEEFTTVKRLVLKTSNSNTHLSLVIEQELLNVKVVRDETNDH